MFVKEITNRGIVIDAPAKVNLFLEVLNRRDDGYHNINSLFQAVSLCDRLTFDLTNDAHVDLQVIDAKDLSDGEENLVVRAVRLFQEASGRKFGLRIKLEKRILIAAGLGGGSSDAAATLIACNLLCDKIYNIQKLAELGLRIGSDVPFFFSSGQAIVGGRGEKIVETGLPIDYHLVLVNPGIGVSTATSYVALKRGLTSPKNPFNLRPCRTVKELLASLRLVGNDFEEVQLKTFPELSGIKDMLLQAGAVMARMSGSGPTFFGIFDKKPESKGLASLEQGNWRAFHVRPVTSSSDF